MRMRLIAATALTCLSVETSLAGPLRPEFVGSHATWVVHFDVEALMGSSVGPFLLKEAPFEGGDFDELRELGIDPVKDIKSITAFGADDNGEDATGILETTDAIDGAIAKVAAHADDYQKIAEGNMVIHSWNDGDESWYLYTKPGAEAGRRLAVLAGSLERLRSAALTLERGAGEKAKCLDGVRPRAGSVLFVSASQIPKALEEHEEASRVMKFARALVLDVGEAAQQIYADITLDTDGPDSATTLMQMALGLKAFGQMACAGEPEMAQICRLFDAIRVAADGAKVRGSFSFDCKALVEIAAQIEAMENADKDDDEGGDDDGGENDERVIVDQQKSVESVQHRRVD